MELNELIRDLKPELMPIKDIKPYRMNAKKHPPEQIEQIIKSITDYGFNDPVAVWGPDNTIIEGHGRYLAAKKMGLKEVPIIRLDHLTDEQRREYTLLHNQLTMNTGWDLDALNIELGSLDLDVSFYGFDLDGEDAETGDGTGQEPETEEDDYEEDPDLEPRVVLGDIWKLGEHRLICGDSTEVTTVDRLMNGEKADLVFTDPPYGMKKEAEGVLNDNLNYDDLLDFNRQWIPLSFGALKDNGSWYCWGTDEPLMDIYSEILKPMKKANLITFRNLITWDKGDAGAGGVSFMGKDGLRSYPVGSEKCLFVMTGVQGFNNNADNYYEAWEPIRLYLYNERIKCGWDVPMMKVIAGHSDKSRDHWTGKSQFNLPTREVYEKFQQWARDNNIDAFKREYDDIKREWYSTRAYFNNTHDTMTDVWPFGRISHEEKQQAGGHATPKPLALCARAIKSSSREGELVLDLFGGSGSTLIACEQLGRRCYMAELDPHYCDVIIDRWQKLTGKTAERLEPEN